MLFSSFPNSFFGILFAKQGADIKPLNLKNYETYFILCHFHDMGKSFARS